MIESMASGIPVICSNRGALVETAGDSAILLEVDKKYTPLSREIPSSLDVELWVKSIINLWDDPETYDLWRQKGLQRSAMWDYSSVLQKYKSTLISLLES